MPSEMMIELDRMRSLRLTLKSSLQPFYTSFLHPQSSAMSVTAPHNSGRLVNRANRANLRTSAELILEICAHLTIEDAFRIATVNKLLLSPEKSHRLMLLHRHVGF